jgi:hypothetical protein
MSAALLDTAKTVLTFAHVTNAMSQAVKDTVTVMAVAKEIASLNAAAEGVHA